MLSELMKYGAMAVKIRAMYGKRIKPAEYDRLLSMTSVAQIADFLKNHPGWSSMLSGIDTADIHRGPLELVLNTGLFEEYTRIIHFIPRRDLLYMKYPVESAEIEQILSFIRHLNAGHPENFRHYIPRNIIGKLHFDINKLAEAKSFAQMLDIIHSSELAPILARFQPAAGENVNYPAVELALEAFHFNHQFKNIEKSFSGNYRKRLENTVGEQADILNITRAVRLIRFFSGSPDELYACLIPVFYKVQAEFFRDLARCPDDAAAMAMLKNSPYKKLFVKTDFQYIEQYQDAFMFDLCHKLIYAAVPDLIIPIAYLIVKQIEIRNLIHIIECVRYGLPADRIRTYITTRPMHLGASV